MAGKDVYLGAMIQSLEDNMTAMVEKMQELVDGIISVANNTAQSLTSLKIKASDKEWINFESAENTQTLSTAGTLTKKLSEFKSLADGTLRLKYNGSFRVFSSNTKDATSTIGLSVVGDDGSSETMTFSSKKTGTSWASSGVDGFIDVPVSNGVTYTFYLTFLANSANHNLYASGQGSICYELTNIVEDGGIIPIS